MYLPLFPLPTPPPAPLQSDVFADLVGEDAPARVSKAVTPPALAELSDLRVALPNFRHALRALAAARDPSLPPIPDNNYA